jgi:hypothetical protein
MGLLEEALWGLVSVQERRGWYCGFLFFGCQYRFDIFGKSCLSPLCMKQHLMLSKTAQKDDVIVLLGIVPRIVLFDMSRNGNVEL